MTALTWDEIGQRIYQTGVDHGVLYLHDGTSVVWNGLINVEESSNNELKAYHLDGVKYLEVMTPADFMGKLKAFTYPEEFDEVNGIGHVNPGFSLYDQPHKSFNLSYRTRIGNDIDGTDYGYKIHILYNVLAKPEVHSFNTLSNSAVAPIEFAWSLTGTPVKLGGFKPTVHISIDSTKTDPEILQLIEDQLYGTALSGASLPTLLQIAEYFGYLGALIIVDHGDGTWSAIDESDTYITMLDETTFWIDNVDAVYLDADTYQVSSTNVD